MLLKNVKWSFQTIPISQRYDCLWVCLRIFWFCIVCCYQNLIVWNLPICNWCMYLFCFSELLVRGIFSWRWIAYPIYCILVREKSHFSKWCWMCRILFWRILLVASLEVICQLNCLFVFVHLLTFNYFYVTQINCCSPFEWPMGELKLEKLPSCFN